MLTTRSLTSTLDRMMSLNRVLDQAFTSAWNGDATSRVWVPALDVVEKHDAYVVVTELPGVDQSQIDINFEQNVLTIRGAKAPSFDISKDGELRVYAAERVTGAFERAIRLPEFVDGDRISAEFQNGLLTVTIPKAQAAQPRKIEIKAAPNATPATPATPELTA
jgi:HSP20 family protein